MLRDLPDFAKGTTASPFPGIAPHGGGKPWLSCPVMSKPPPMISLNCVNVYRETRWYNCRNRARYRDKAAKQLSLLQCRGFPVPTWCSRPILCSNTSAMSAHAGGRAGSGTSWQEGTGSVQTRIMNSFLKKPEFLERS